MNENQYEPCESEDRKTISKVFSACSDKCKKIISEHPKTSFVLSGLALGTLYVLSTHFPSVIVANLISTGFFFRAFFDPRDWRKINKKKINIYTIFHFVLILFILKFVHLH